MGLLVLTLLERQTFIKQIHLALTRLGRQMLLVKTRRLSGNFWRNYTESDRDSSVKLTAKALMEVVESGSKNIEIAVITRDEVTILSEAEIEQLVAQIEAEKTEEDK